VSAPVYLASPQPDSKRGRYVQRLQRLEREWIESGHRDHCREISEFMLPRAGRFTLWRPNDGRKVMSKIVDPHATYALRTLSAGMTGGLTSPARPWFKLDPPDPDMADYAPVRLWLDQVTQRMERMFSKTNLYRVFPPIYESLGAFGPACMYGLDDFKNVLRFHEIPIGSYFLQIGADGKPNTVYRRFSMTVGQIVEMFGDSPRNVSQHVLNMYKTGKIDEPWEICHVTEPNLLHDPTSPMARDRVWKSCWFEVAGDGEQMLRESGFLEQPFMAPRWWAKVDDIYGSTVGRDALPDVKQLQLLTKKMYWAIDMQNEPPAVAHVDLKNKTAKMVPGGVSFVPNMRGNEAFRAAYEIDPDLNAYQVLIQQKKDAISRGLFEDLFLMLSELDRKQITATEIAERKEEKLIQLGPVLESVEDELLNPLIDRAFARMLRVGALPPPPPELRGKPLRVEYISILAQAQRAVGTASIERVANFILGLSQVFPEAGDKLDVDATIDSYGRKIGVDTKVIRSAEDTARVRAQRQQQQAAAAAAMAAKPVASAVKDLSAAPTQPEDGETALSRTLQSIGLQ
jgi:hypothetical protein